MAHIDLSAGMTSSVPFFHSQAQLCRPMWYNPLVGLLLCHVHQPLIAPSTYKNYSDQKLVSAIEVVQQGETSTHLACEENGLPGSTLQENATGKSGLRYKIWVSL